MTGERKEYDGCAGCEKPLGGYDRTRGWCQKCLPPTTAEWRTPKPVEAPKGTRRR